MQDVRGGRGAGLCHEDGLYTHDERTAARDGAADGRLGENHPGIIPGGFSPSNEQLTMNNEQLYSVRPKERVCMKEDNLVAKKSKAFAIRIIRLYQYLVSEKKESVISKQVLRSGTSIGANVRESTYGQSKADFIAKMQIALKETGETEYWIELLVETEYITEEAGNSLISDCKELIKIITSILRTAKI